MDKKLNFPLESWVRQKEHYFLSIETSFYRWENGKSQLWSSGERVLPLFTLAFRNVLGLQLPFWPQGKQTKGKVKMSWVDPELSHMISPSIWEMFYGGTRRMGDGGAPGAYTSLRFGCTFLRSGHSSETFPQGGRRHSQLGLPYRLNSILATWHYVKVTCTEPCSSEHRQDFC